MASQSRTAVVAVGGNSLITDPAHQSIPDQYRAAAIGTAQHIAEMVVAGWNVVVTHGSGPQVGFVLRRSEIAIDEVPPVPMIMPPPTCRAPSATCSSARCATSSAAAASRAARPS